jgi:flagellar assembly protein FliH
MSENAHPPAAATDPAAWVLPTIDGPVLPLRRRSTDLEATERAAWERGHAEGHAAGLAAAQQQMQAATAEAARLVQQLQSICDFMTRPLAQLDQEVLSQLATLAGAIARHIVRRELKLHPDEIVAVIRETVALLPANARDVRVHLHPQDAALVRERLSPAASDRTWSVAEDPMLTRGGCRVTSESSTINAEVEQRLGAAIATVLGDERGAQTAGVT